MALVQKHAFSRPAAERDIAISQDDAELMLDSSFVWTVVVGEEEGTVDQCGQWIAAFRYMCLGTPKPSNLH